MPKKVVFEVRELTPEEEIDLGKRLIKMGRSKCEVCTEKCKHKPRRRNGGS